MALGNTVKVTIVGDADKLKAAFGEADKSAQSFGDKMGDVGKKMQGVGLKMSAALTLPVVAGAKVIFDKASDMGESMSKVSTIFGDAGDDILAWSKTTAKSMGVSRQSALDAAGTFGNMFTQLGIATPLAASMSTEMVGLASDFASFHNANPTDVLEAMSSAFRGEYDALQKYVPTINAANVEQKALAMTGKALAAELTAADKALATQTLMLEGAGAAAGDFARTSDSAANQQKVLSAQFADSAATLGEKLMPIGQIVIGWLTTLADKFSGLSPNVQKFIMIGLGLAAVLGPIITLIGTLATVMAFLAANPIVLVVVAIAALVAGLVWAYKNVEWFRNGVNHVISSLAISAQWLGKVFAAVWDGVVAGFRWLTDTIKSRINWVIGLINRLIAGVNTVNSGLNKIPGVNLPIFGTIPMLAKGGIVTSPTLAMIGEAGPEAVVPLDRYSGGRGGGDTFVVNFNGVTTREAADQVVRILNDHFGRGGGLANGRGGSLRPA